MTISPPAVLLGSQEPALSHLPRGAHSHAVAEEAIELCDQIGMTLDEAQCITLRSALATTSDDRWAAFEVANIQPRQNGKGDAIQARELAGLFLLSESLIIHTAHEFPTANEAFLRMAAVVESDPWLSSKVQRIRWANGEQGVELKSGARLKYRARTGGAGRGFAGASLVVYDEAYALKAEHVAASLPTLSTHPNPQVWYASSAGLSDSSALWAIRRRALSGDGGRLAYCEWTAEDVRLAPDGRVEQLPIDVHDRKLWALANPAMGYRISEAYMESELDAMGPEKFARERLGVWDPPADSSTPSKLPAVKWAATVTDRPPPAVESGHITIAFDVAKDGRWSSIAVALGSVRDPYVELVEHRRDVGWLPDRLVELVQRHSPVAVGCNGAGAAGAQVAPVLAAFRDAGLDVDLLVPMGAADYKRACGGFFSDVVEGRLRRPASEVLDAAAAVAGERPLGDAWAWDGRGTEEPISPIVAVTVARALLPVEARTAIDAAANVW